MGRGSRGKALTLVWAAEDESLNSGSSGEKRRVVRGILEALN